MAAGTFAPDPALPNSGFPVSIAQYDDDTKRQIVRAFAAYEMSGVDTADRIILGVVPEQLATDVERSAQIDIHGFDNVLQADGLRHGAKHDGRTGNKPVTPEDVAALLDIFDTYNNITVTSKRGETSIKLSKTGADGMTYVAVIGKKKGHIFTKNMWKGQTKGDGSFRRTDAHNAPASTPAAAANYEPSTDSLPENVQDGKGTTGFLPSTADATGRPQAQAREPMRDNRADAAATPQGTAGVDVMDELVRSAGTAVSAQEAAEIDRRNAEAAERFRREYAAWDKFEQLAPFNVGETPAYLRMLGVPRKRMIFRIEDINHLKRQHPNMTDHEILQIPDVIGNPIVVMRSRTVPGSRYTMFGTVYDQAGVPVLAIIDVEPDAAKGYNPNSIRIVNAYGKDTYPQEFIDKSKIVYLTKDQERIRQWETASGLRLPSPASITGFTHIISDNGGNSNGSAKTSQTEFANAGRGSDAPASTAKGAAQVDVMDELVRGAGTAVSAQETEGTGARARSVMEEVLAGTEEPGARPAGQGRRRYRAGVNRADTAGRLDASDRIQLRVLDGLGKKYGVKIVIEDTIRYGDGEGRVYAGTANAYYDRSDGTIHVALDAEGGAYLFFAVHELTHKLRAENADAYAALEAFVLNKLETSELYGALTQGEGGTLEERIASVRALYAARGQELSRGEAIEEIVCDAIPVILTDEQTVRELVRTDRTLAERIRDFFEEFYNELTRQLAGVVYGPGNRVEAAALMNDTETVRELAELFRMALESSADLQYELLTQSGSAIEEAGTAEHKRFSAKDDRAASIKEQIRAYAEKLNGMQAVAVIESGSRPKKNGHPDRLLERQELQRYYGNTTSSVDRQGFGRIEFDQNAIAQLVKYLNSDAEFAAAKAAPAVVKRGIEIDHHMEHKGRNDIESYTFAAPVVLNGKRGNEAVVVQRTNRNKPHAVRIVMPDGSGFDLDVNERNSPDTSERLPQRATVYGPEGTVSADSIHNSQEEVNSELPDLRFSRKAGEGTGSAIEEAGNDKRRGRRLSARADGEDAITMEDVAAIQSIGRKSVNAFSSDEIRTAEPFARRYWRELGVKSPFFRAWFGDWRANDRMPVQLVRVAGADAPKSGRAINADTGRPISWGDRLRSETWAHGTKSALESIKGIDRIIETAVLLDTVAVKSISKSKLPGTAFMHSLYSLADDGSGLTLYRLFAEEAVPARGGEPFTRAYELKEIKEVATTPDSVLSVSEGLTDGAPATTYTVADLFAFVKENVPDFQPKPVHPALLNEDGTPKVFYHGTGSEFYEFSTEQIGAREGSFFFAENPEDAAGYGRNVMPVYLSAENLADYDAQPSEFYRLENKRAQVAYLKERGYDGWYADMDSDGWGEISVFSPEQIKSATDNAGTFDRRNQNIRFSQKAGERTESAPGEAKRQGVDGRTFTYEEFMERYRDGVEVVRVRELNTFPSPADRRSLPSSALREARRNGNPKNTAGRAYIYFPDTGTNAYVDEKSFTHGLGDYDTQYALACMNATEIAKCAIAVNRLNDNEKHRIPSTVYLSLVEDADGQFVVRFIVENGTNRVTGIEKLYAIRKSPAGPSAASVSTPTAHGDTSVAGLRKGTGLRRASSYKINIADFLQAVNGTAAGNAVLPPDVLRRPRTGRGNEPRVSPNLRFSEKTTAEERDAAPAVSEKVLGNVAKRILQRTGSGYSADRLTDGLKTLLHADAEQRRETADALARQVPIPRWQGLAVEKRTGIAYNGERKRAPCGGRGGPRGGVRGEMDACCKNRSNGWF